MRDPARIQKVLSAIEHYWEQNPDLRLGQLVSNFATGTPPLFYMEDEALLEAVLNATFRKPKRCPLMFWNNDHGYQCQKNDGHDGGHLV